MDETTISSLALIAAVLSLTWQAFVWKKQDVQARLKDNLTLLAELKMRLAEIPEAYRFHGITKEMLQSHQINEKELSYLTANFISGQIYYESISGNNTEPFHENDYRTTMCRTEGVKKAWPLVKLLLDDTNYRKKIEKTIGRFNS